MLVGVGGFSCKQSVFGCKVLCSPGRWRRKRLQLGLTFSGHMPLGVGSVCLAIGAGIAWCRLFWGLAFGNLGALSSEKLWESFSEGNAIVFVLATREYYHIGNVLVQPVGKRQCGLSSLNCGVFKVELIQKKTQEKNLVLVFTLQVKKDKILLYAELCKPAWTSHVTLPLWWSQIFGMLGVISGMMRVCLSSTSAPSRFTDVACALGTSRDILCALLFTREWFFSFLSHEVGRLSCFHQWLKQSLSHWEKFLLSDSSSVIWEE